MWGNLILSSVYSNNSLSFASSKSDVLIHLIQWQYWWWFWFSIFFIFYYNIAIKVIIFRSLKFYPKINTSMRPRGRWGDMIIAIVPIYWCTNILINSNSLLKVMEWQDSSSFITVRVRGRQWYWVYKLSSLSNVNVVNVDVMLGYNSTFSLSNLYSSEQGGNLFDFWLRWNNKFFLKNIFKSGFTEKLFFKDSKNYYISTYGNGSGNFTKDNYSYSNNLTGDYINNKDINNVDIIHTKPNVHNYILDECYLNTHKWKNNFFFNRLSFKRGVFSINRVLSTLKLVSGSYELPVNLNLFNLYVNSINYISNTNYLFGYESAIKYGYLGSTISNKHYIDIVKSYKPKYTISMSFSEPNIFSKKPRYFLTLRQKPVKDWFSYINNGINISSNCKLYSHIGKSIKSYIISHKNNFNLLNSNRLLNTTTTLVLPTNKTISVISNSFDVVHSWFIPGLGIKIDCVPGRSTHHVLNIDVPGFYYGQCAEICGRFHHHMPIKICALVFEHFLLWWQHYFMYLNLADNWEDSLKISRSRYSIFFKN